MDRSVIVDRIRRGRTDLVLDLLDLPDWREALSDGLPHGPLSWFVYYDDVTALKAVLRAGGDLTVLDLDQELRHAAFFGHWKVCDFLLLQGADVNGSEADTGETALHSALCKAGRPYYSRVVRLLLERGARVDARTTPGVETGAFMRDVRTCGETPLHRAAAYAEEETIRLLLDAGADPEARDAHGDSPLAWASRHLRPRRLLSLLTFGSHHVQPTPPGRYESDHGAGWGNGMEWNLLGDYLPESSS